MRYARRFFLDNVGGRGPTDAEVKDDLAAAMVFEYRLFSLATLRFLFAVFDRAEPSASRPLPCVIGLPGTTWQRQKQRPSATRSKRLPMPMILHMAWSHTDDSGGLCLGGQTKRTRCYWYLNVKPRKAGSAVASWARWSVGASGRGSGSGSGHEYGHGWGASDFVSSFLKSLGVLLVRHLFSAMLPSSMPSEHLRTHRLLTSCRDFSCSKHWLSIKHFHAQGTIKLPPLETSKRSLALSRIVEPGYLCLPFQVSPLAIQRFATLLLLLLLTTDCPFQGFLLSTQFLPHHCQLSPSTSVRYVFAPISSQC